MKPFHERGKRASSTDEQPSDSKKARLECVYGKKCYRKNPAHFEGFSHRHLNEILSNQKDERTLSLPSDFDVAHKKLVLEQLSIVQDLQRKSCVSQDFSVSDPKGALNTSSSSPGSEPHMKTSVEKPHSSSSKADKDISSEKNAGSGVRGGASSSGWTASSSSGGGCGSGAKPGTGNGPDRTEMKRMIYEATKHHGDVQAKLDAAAPYHFFLTSISDSPQTHNEPLTITFTELLDKSLGDLESSLQINFMVELGWMLAQYFYTGNRFKPLTLLYGVENEDLNETVKLPSNVTAVKVKPPTAFGHHHTKMSIMAYTDKSIRVIVHTANLVESDWDNRTQGLWVSPRLPFLPGEADTTAGESPTNFKSDLLRYLSVYRLPQLQEWLSRVRHADFSSVRVCFIASAPGTHYGPELHMWGHRRLLSLLKAHVEEPKDPRRPWSSWPIVGQFSSIGTLGNTPTAWVCGELQASMGAPAPKQEVPPVKLIYPSLNNVKQSHDNLLGGACLPYQQKIHQKQTWLTDFLHLWKSDKRFRSQAMPHIKSYARISPCGNLLSWFLLTSANLSKAAWGAETKTKLPGQGLRILSYEAGVLFLPKFIVDDLVFNLDTNATASSETSKFMKGTGNRNEYPTFPLHYDLPLKKYGPEDTPWFYDYLR